MFELDSRVISIKYRCNLLCINIKSHLQSIRILLDSIQNTSNAYKDHFESTTLDALDSDCSADTLKGCISNFLKESDNPSE